MNRILLDLGFIQIHYYSITMLLGFIFGYFIVMKETKKQNIDETKINDMLFYMTILSFVGARIYYVIFNLDYYLSYPLDIFKTWEGGMAIYGGIIASVIWIIYYCKKHSLPLLKILDIFAVAVIIGQVIGRWGNFFNSEAYGGVVSKAFLVNLHIPAFIINGMYIDGAFHHPTFLYESTINLVGFVIMLFILNKYKNLKTGMLTSFYLVWYGLNRYFIEGMRTDSLMFYDIRISQLLSIFIVIGGIIYFIYSIKKNQSYRKKVQ